MNTGNCKPLSILIIATPDFNLATTTAFIDPFRAANYLEGRMLFRWQIVSQTGENLTASNGISVETTAISQTTLPADIVIVSSSWAPELHSSNTLRAFLIRAARSGCDIGGLDTGAFILADAGLLSGRRATVHYEHIDALIELHPDVEVTEDLFVIDNRRLSCCGGTASADLALQILRDRLGETVANSAARYVFHQSMRSEGMPQLPTLVEPLGHAVPDAVRNAIRLMEAHLEDPIPIPEIGGRTGISQRQLNRLFARHLGKSTALYYRDIRLDRARGLVTQTEMPLTEVAIASGFRSQVTFSRAYRDRFGLPPSRDRTEGRVPFEFRAWPMHRYTSDVMSKSD
ncbi:MAG: GlxA family transcriptional regulator [Pseudomonadota bacterium]